MATPWDVEGQRTAISNWRPRLLSRVVEVLQRQVVEFPVATAGYAYRGMRGKVATALGIIKHRARPSDCRGRLGAGSVVARNSVVGRFGVIIGIKRRVVKHLVRRPGRTAVAGRCRGGAGPKHAPRLEPWGAIAARPRERERPAPCL